MLRFSFHARAFILCVLSYDCHWSQSFVTNNNLSGWTQPRRDSHFATRQIASPSPYLSRRPSECFATPVGNARDTYQICIEYCSGCHWGLRGFWNAQELLSTFRDDRSLGAVSVIPSAVAGRFVVYACQPQQTQQDSKGQNITTILWDRQEQDGFPEMKTLKQAVRDHINPSRFLGHSDSSEKQKKEGSDAVTAKVTVLDLSGEPPEIMDTTMSPSDLYQLPTHHVTITYCTGCQWLLRAAYVAQELVSTFSQEIGAITLIPSRPPAKGGSFLVTVDQITIWDRFEQGRFPETKELKQLVRNILDPGRDLGHVDHKKGTTIGTTSASSISSSSSSGSDESAAENLDDDEAAESRKFFGVM